MQDKIDNKKDTKKSIYTAAVLVFEVLKLFALT